MFNIGVNTDQALKQLHLLTLSSNKKRRITRGAGRKVRRDSKKRIQKQTGIDGRKWQGRANGRKTKMLTKLGRQINVKNNSNSAVVSYANPVIAKIAKAHHIGADIDFTANQAKKSDKQKATGKATRSQAKALRLAGYKIRRNKGKGWKTPTLKYITENVSTKQAGLMLRILRNGESKQKWTIKLPKRTHLGQSESELIALKNYILNEATRLST